MCYVTGISLHNFSLILNFLYKIWANNSAKLKPLEDILLSQFVGKFEIENTKII